VSFSLVPLPSDGLALAPTLARATKIRPLDLLAEFLANIEHVIAPDNVAELSKREACIQALSGKDLLHFRCRSLVASPVPAG